MPNDKKSWSRKAPAYQEYAANLMSDRSYKFLSLEEKGFFHLLRLECWVNLTIPASPKSLAVLANVSEEKASVLIEKVSYAFRRVGDDYVCPELEEYRNEVKRRNDARAIAGKKGGETKAKNRKESLTAEQQKWADEHAGN